jgi:hypothetical protein
MRHPAEAGAQANEKALHTWKSVSILKGLATQPFDLMKPLLGKGQADEFSHKGRYRSKFKENG